MNTPFVSIFSITYNQEKYIKKCIDGILTQQCNFDFEIIIIDDASTDRTPEIIKTLHQKYPHIIKPIFHKKNLFYNNLGEIPYAFIDHNPQGKYIALCEGDDIWIDNLKLQKQVDFLEKNDDCSLCFHPCTTIFGNKSGKNYWWGPDKEIKSPTKFTITDLISSGDSLKMSTLTMMFRRKDIQEYPQWPRKSPIADLPLKLILANQGKIGYLPDNMATHIRESTPHSWSANRKELEWILKDLKAAIKCYDLFDRHTNYKYHKLVHETNRKWVVQNITKIQHKFGRAAQPRLLFKHFKYLTRLDKQTLSIWGRFLFRW